MGNTKRELMKVVYVLGLLLLCANVAAKEAVESVEDMPGFGNDDLEEDEEAASDHFDMNTAESLDQELGEVSLMEVSQDEPKKEGEEVLAPKVTSMPPTRAAPNKERGVVSRDCMNECGGLCRTLCSKFKALK